MYCIGTAGKPRPCWCVLSMRTIDEYYRWGCVCMFWGEAESSCSQILWPTQWEARPSSMDTHILCRYMLITCESNKPEKSLPRCTFRREECADKIKGSVPAGDLGTVCNYMAFCGFPRNSSGEQFAH